MIFVQLGATRDGLDPYLAAARTRGIQAILIETPDYIQWRKSLQRQEFDQTMAIDHLADPQEVLAALAHLSEPPTLLLAGFERYNGTAYRVAQHLQIRPYRVDDPFLPLHKGLQRQSLSLNAPSIHQPCYFAWSCDQSSDPAAFACAYPSVIKPVDGGGSLGVFLIHTQEELEQVRAILRTLTNYDGGSFQGFIMEEYVSGTEYSVQGIVRQGAVQLLTICKKWIALEPQARETHGFREQGHIAVPASTADDTLLQFVDACIAAVAYRNGPFHIDFIRSQAGYTFLEMGYRLSGGGLARLVQRVSGYNWADEVFRLHLNERPCPPPVIADSVAIGQCIIQTREELAALQRVQAQRIIPLEIEQFQMPAHLPDASSLSSDLLRHSGFVGRVTVMGKTIEEVETTLSMYCAFSQQKAHSQSL